MNQNSQHVRNSSYTPHPGRKAVSHITGFLWCAEIWYYIQLAFSVYLLFDQGDDAVFVIGDIANIVLSGLAVTATQFSKFYLRSSPIDSVLSKKWFDVLLGLTIFFLLALMMFIGYLSDIQRETGDDGIMIISLVISGYCHPFIIISFAACWFRSSYKKITNGGSENGEYELPGYGSRGGSQWIQS